MKLINSGTPSVTVSTGHGTMINRRQKGKETLAVLFIQLYSCKSVPK